MLTVALTVTAIAGDVLAGSLIGESDFCPGGSFRDEHGNHIVGLVARTFNCPEGSLKIGFNPEQPGLIQRSNWHVVSGSALRRATRRRLGGCEVGQ